MDLSRRKEDKKVNWCMPSQGGRKEGIIMKKFCTRCGKPFESIGREVICPACKQAAAEESKRAAVERAKMASWTGESVPVRISGRASAVIRKYGAANGLPFAAALDDLLKASDFFKKSGKAWEEVEPYKSHRRDKAAADKQAAAFLHDKQEAPQDVQAAGKPQEVKAAARKASKATSKASASKASKK